MAGNNAEGLQDAGGTERAALDLNRRGLLRCLPRGAACSPHLTVARPELREGQPAPLQQGWRRCRLAGLQGPGKHC